MRTMKMQGLAAALMAVAAAGCCSQSAESAKPPALRVGTMRASSERWSVDHYPLSATIEL